MQRLFSMFPDGRAAFALLCLRISVATILFLGAKLAHPNSQAFTWAAAVLAISLCIGFATPICASLCCLLEIYLLLGMQGAATQCVIVSALVALTLTLLGPGAYSVDSQLFGRKKVIFRAGEDHERGD